MGYVGTYLLFSVATLLALLASGAALDRGWSRALGATSADRFLLRLTMGIAAWTAALFTLAAAQVLTRTPVMVLVGAGLAGGGWAAWQDRGSRRPLSSSASQLAGTDAWVVLATLTLGAVAAALFLQVLRPIVAWDADVYHLTLPRLWTDHGGFLRIPFNVYSNWPSGVQLLYAGALLAKDFVLAKALHYLFAIVLVAAVARWVAARSTAAWGLVAGGCLLASPVFVFEARIAYVDIAVALFYFAGFVFCDRTLDSDDPAQARLWLLAAGLAGGLMAGAKLNGIVGASTLAILFVTSHIVSGRGLRRLTAALATFAAPVGALWLPWLAKSTILTGNPVYPLLYGRFGGPEWSHALADAHRTWNQSLGMGRTAMDYLLLLPRALFAGGEGYERFDGRLHPLVALLLLIALAAARRESQVRRALAVASMWFVAWAFTSQQMRLLIPALPLLACAGGLGAARLTASSKASRLWQRGAIIAVLVLLAGANAHYLGQAPTLVRIFHQRGADVREDQEGAVCTFVNNELPPPARLLFVHHSRGFFCERDFLADSFFEASQLADWMHRLGDRDAILADLRSLGITHVLVRRESAGPVFPDAFVALLAEPTHRRVYDASDPSGSYFIVELAL
ncbi:MAG: hypothetical protein VYE73_07920 [Acidobacteriota bacterium]|nr:hypothetical protein [Acidobacteriota bacterium]